MRGDSRIEIGFIARAHGIRGEVVVVTHDADSDTLGAIETIYVRGQPKKVLAARDTVRGWLVKLDGVITRNDAEPLKGAAVEVDRDLLELDEDDVILGDLVGCKCITPDGTVWGVIVAVEASELQDRLVIHDGDQEKMLPLVDVFVTNIDLDAGIVSVVPPEGLPTWTIK
jgi:16S rRNA processing protein RimM